MLLYIPNNGKVPRFSVDNNVVCSGFLIKDDSVSYQRFKIPDIDGVYTSLVRGGVGCKEQLSQLSQIYRKM